MNRAQFIRLYAKNSGVSLGELRRLGLVAVQCDCGAPGCRGWQMVTQRKGNEMEAVTVETTLTQEQLDPLADLLPWKRAKGRS